MEIVVRPVTGADLPHVGLITVTAYAADGLLHADSDYELQLADAARRDREAEIWVASHGDEVVGSVTFCRPGSVFAEISRDDEGEFRMLSVDPTWRRRGVARALVARCIERSRELGDSALVLSSMRESAGARRLYERLGFLRLPERDWSPVEGVDLLAFTLPLDRPGPGSAPGRPRPG